jgi:hypothetical protein
MNADPPRTLYRLVRSNPPTLDDFMSYEALKVPPRRPLTSRQRDHWRGVSFYATQAAARLRARASPQLGSFIAEMQVPDEVQVRIEQGGRDLDHYNVWAERPSCSAGSCPSSRWSRYTNPVQYELWDTASANLLDDFATEAEALDSLAALLANNDPDMADDLVLLRVGGPDGGATVARGTELAQRARAIASKERQPVE